MENPNHPRYIRRRKLFRTIFGIFSLSGIMFAFQACYGTPKDFGQDVLIKGKVTSEATKVSVAGIKVMVNQSGQYTLTAVDGTFSLYCERMPEYNLVFSGSDQGQNKGYQVCDTTVKLADRSEQLTVNAELK